jgi:hypothetical protein
VEDVAHDPHRTAAQSQERVTRLLVIVGVVSVLVLVGVFILALHLGAQRATSGQVVAGVEGPRDGVGYQIQTEALVGSDGPERMSWVDLQLEPTTYTDAMPSITVEVGETLCTNPGGDNWLQYFDDSTGTSNLVLSCDDFVYLQDLDEDVSVTVVP